MSNWDNSDSVGRLKASIAENTFRNYKPYVFDFTTSTGFRDPDYFVSYLSQTSQRPDEWVVKFINGLDQKDKYHALNALNLFFESSKIKMDKEDVKTKTGLKTPPKVFIKP